MDSLTIAIQQFSQWRSSKGKSRGIISPQLWEAATRAAIEFDPITVGKALGVSTLDLRKRIRALEAPTAESDVVAFPSEETARQSPAKQRFMADIFLCDQVCLRIPSGTSREDVTVLLSALGRLYDPL